MFRLRRAAAVLVVVVLSVAFDQWTKVVATEALYGKPATSHWGDLFRLGYTTNDGAFLSLGSNLPEPIRSLLLTGAVGVLLLVIVGYTIWTRALTTIQWIGYALIAGGGISNWIDRARFQGKVVDFMNLGIGTWLRTGVFNVADLWIVFGIVILLIDGWRLDRKNKRASPQAT